MRRLESGDPVWFRAKEGGLLISAVVCVTDQFLMELQIEVPKIYKNFRFNLSPFSYGQNFKL